MSFHSNFGYPVSMFKFQGSTPLKCKMDTPQKLRGIFEGFVISKALLSPWKSKGTPPMPPRRPYLGMMVVKTPIIRPYLLGGVALGGYPQISMISVSPFNLRCFMLSSVSGQMTVMNPTFCDPERSSRTLKIQCHLFEENPGW